MINESIEKLIDKYLQDYKNKLNLEIVVKPSIPIIWFGDIEKYLNSKIKVITVGLNPSDKEFTELHFPQGLDYNNKDVIYFSLNDYFNYNPYKKYFSHFEHILNYLAVSYNGKRLSNLTTTDTAIHIDIFSSIATTPTWHKLSNEQKKSINQYRLFYEFIEILKPNIILISVDKNTVLQTFSINEALNQPLFSEKNAHGPQIEVYKQNNIIIVYGRNINGTPFSVNNEIVKNACNVILQNI